MCDGNPQGKLFWFELAQGSSYWGFELSGVNCKTQRLILTISNLLSGFQIIHLYVYDQQNVYKTTNKRASSIHMTFVLIKSFFSSNQLKLSPWFFTHIFKDWTYYEVKLQIKRASFSMDNGWTSRLSSFYCISNLKNFIPKHLDNAPVDFDLT